MKAGVTEIRWSFYMAAILSVLCIAFLSVWLIHARTPDAVTVHWNTVHQTVDGFGASATGYVEGFSPEHADQFFNVQTGLGLSLLRLNLVPDTVNDDCGCVSNNPRYHCAVGTESQILTGDLQVAQLAAARGVHIFASPWSPPAEMKSSGKFCGGGAMKGGPGNYAKYASRLASFPPLLKANGVSIEAISVQNEPDVENEGYDTCKWTGQQIHDFVPYLAEALSGAGFKSIKIAVPEETSWTFDMLGLTMSDPEIANKVGLVLGHAYGVERPSGLPQTSGRHVWQTEVSGYNKFDGSMADGLEWARYIHNYMTVGANAWMFWSLDCGEQFYNQANNMCLTDQKSHLAKRAYVLGQYARFIRPGWQRIGVANKGALLITAYKGPENKFAIVAVNNGAWEVRKQTFALSGVTSHRSQIEPWITSASASLERKPAIHLGDDGASFTYSIPADSVVTFEGQAD